MSQEQNYLHTYDEKEQARLTQQAAFLSTMIYAHLDLGQPKKLLEIGCGTGGQTLQLLNRFPALKITAVDISAKQIEQAKKYLAENSEHLSRVNFIHIPDGNLDEVPHDFDTVFLCWVLEHVPQPLAILQQAHHHLLAEGKIYITEVYNSSFRVHPVQPAIDKYWQAFNAHQEKLGGHPDVGLYIGQLMAQAGFKNIHTQFIGQHHDLRDNHAKELMFDYFQALMLSADDGLRAEGSISKQQTEALKSAFDSLKKDEQSIFYYAAMQGWGQR